MGYRDNVQIMCARVGISNPIQEEDLHVEAVAFYCQGVETKIVATDMNRAGRLFFQVEVAQPFLAKTTAIETERLALLKNHAAKFFAENWEDAEKVGRSMLIAFKAADGIVIHWR